jgi:hypothetical protein
MLSFVRDFNCLYLETDFTPLDDTYFTIRAEVIYKYAWPYTIIRCDTSQCQQRKMT